MEKVSFKVTTKSHSITFEFDDYSMAAVGFKDIIENGIKEYDPITGETTLCPPSQIIEISSKYSDLFTK